MRTRRAPRLDELGYHHEHANRLHAEGGCRAKYDCWKPFEAHAVEPLLSDYSRCAFDFGAGHSVFEDPVLFARVERLLAEFKYVILLLPLPDPGSERTTWPSSLQASYAVRK